VVRGRDASATNEEEAEEKTAEGEMKAAVNDVVHRLDADDSQSSSGHDTDTERRNNATTQEDADIQMALRREY